MKPMVRATQRLAAMAAVMALVLAACTGDAAQSSAAGASDGGDATTVEVTLQEWAVVPAEDSAPAGDVTFSVTNDGPEDIHEFVILRTDLDPGDLPVDSDGVVDEEGGGIEVVDEIEDIPVGETMEVTATLEAGSYVLICNVWSEDEGEAHYSMGMRAAFSATE